MLQKLKQRIKDFLRGFSYKKWLIYGLIAALIVSLSLKTKETVKAASSHLYPSYCLGGWQNPQNAGGEPNLTGSAEAGDFTTENSAILDASVAQIFCGYFSIEQRTNPPAKVYLHFSWNVESKSAQPVDQPATEGQESATETQKFDSTVPASEPSPEPTPPSSSSSPSVAPDEPVQTSPPVQPPDTPPADNQESAPDPNVEPQSFLDWLVPQAFAEEMSADELSSALQRQIIPQEESIAASGFVEISYSFNGIDWKLLNRANAANWKNFSAEIPVTSWADLQNLQIAVAAVPSLDSQPKIFLDGMWLEVEYDRTVAEALADVGNAVVKVVGDVADATGEVIQTVSEAVTDVFTPQPDQIAEQQATSTPLAEELKNQDTQQEQVLGQATSTPEIIKEKKLLFSLGQSLIDADRMLSWYSREDIRNLGGEKELQTKVSQSPWLSSSGDQKSLQISGYCRKAYFVILLYKNAEDYKANPTSFVFNSAYKCERGKLDFNLNRLPTDIGDGNYYLLIAEEDLHTPWVPISPVVPIKINSIVEER